jgi:hypothetical protein
MSNTYPQPSKTQNGKINIKAQPPLAEPFPPNKEVKSKVRPG